jgi:hypothetical protein
MRLRFARVMRIAAVVTLSLLVVGLLLIPMLPSKSVGNHWASITDQRLQISEGRYGAGAWRFARLDDGQEGTLRLPMGQAIPEPGTRLCVAAVKPGFGGLLRLRRVKEQDCGPDTQQ